MSASFYDLLKYAKTGIASPEMTAYDKMRAVAMAGGGTIKTLTGVPPLSFKSNGKPLVSWSMLGNFQQTGTPSPDNIIMPEFCGKLVGTDWIIPITNAGQTQNVYLGQVQTVRRIKKVVFDGSENWQGADNIATKYLDIWNYDKYKLEIGVTCMSTHYSGANSIISGDSIPYNSVCFYRASSPRLIYLKGSEPITLADFKAYLASQYAAGTPVTVWYVLAEPKTGIVNEPLCKIGDYVDELHSEDAGVTIPTAKGANTLTVDTELQPSEMTITYRG